MISHTASEPAEVSGIRLIVNGTITEAETEDETASFEYTSPQSPTCNPETDYGETVVLYAPEGYWDSGGLEPPPTDAGECSSETPKPRNIWRIYQEVRK